MADSFPKPIRLSLELSPELNSTLENLAKQIHGTKSDVLRKAIALMELAVRAKSEGRRIGIAKLDEELAVEVVGI